MGHRQPGTRTDTVKNDPEVRIGGLLLLNAPVRRIMAAEAIVG